MKIAMLITVLFTLISCSTSKYEITHGKNVKFVNQAPDKCKPFATVYSSSDGDIDDLLDLVRNCRHELRNETGVRGGNMVELQTNNVATEEGKAYVVFSGTAYKCGVTPGSSSNTLIRDRKTITPRSKKEASKEKPVFKRRSVLDSVVNKKDDKTKDKKNQKKDEKKQ